MRAKFFKPKLVCSSSSARQLASALRHHVSPTLPSSGLPKGSRTRPTLDGKEKPGADSRTPERPSGSVQSGPIGQYEYTNAAGGVGWHHLRSYTKALRGNLGEIELPSPPGWWCLAFAFRPSCPLSSKAAGSSFKTCGASCHWPAAFAAGCHCCLPKLVRGARMG